ncbi:MAG: hypothetical protein WCW27_03970 [Patescibacteria group bacterium]|jgi:hypothetical protein
MYGKTIGYKEKFILQHPRILFYWIKFINYRLYFGIGLLIPPIILIFFYFKYSLINYQIFFDKGFDLYIALYIFIFTFILSVDLKNISLFKVRMAKWETKGYHPDTIYVLLPNGLYQLPSVIEFYALFSRGVINYVNEEFVDYFKNKNILKSIIFSDKNPIRETGTSTVYAIFEVITKSDLIETREEYYYSCANEKIFGILYPNNKAVIELGHMDFFEKRKNIMDSVDGDAIIQYLKEINAEINKRGMELNKYIKLTGVKPRVDQAGEGSNPRV